LVTSCPFSAFVTAPLALDSVGGKDETHSIRRCRGLFARSL
jgi:hypothetical protein